MAFGLQLQKEVLSLPKQPSCEKGVQPSKRPEKVRKSKVAAKKWLQ